MDLNSKNYNPANDITTLFLDNETLNSIDDLLIVTRQHKIQLETKINALNHLYDDKQEIENTEETILTKIVKNFEQTESMASITQNNIKNLTEGLSHLDNAKLNLTQSLSLFQNFKIMVDSYFECKELLHDGLFLQMVSPYKIMCSLSENTFNTYKSVESINQLLSLIWRLKSEISTLIKRKFADILQNKYEVNENTQKQLRDGACELLDSSSKTRIEIVDWTIDKLLYEIKEIFQLDDEAGSLENLSRRYIFFKKLLNNFNAKYASIFLPSWELPLKITKKFYSITRNDLKLLLKKEFKGTSPSINLFMKALQTTLDFEKYIDIRFSNKIQDGKLSSCFEPYLSLWISHQGERMDSKLLSYMSELKIPDNSAESLVVPSSADLFRTYRTILSETLELMGDSRNDSILISLSQFFSKWLIEYSKKILTPLQIKDDIEKQDKLEVVKYTVLLINTYDYCSTTIDQLDEKLSSLSNDSRNVSEPFTRAKEIYDELLTQNNNILLKKVIPIDFQFAIKEFDNTNWAHIAVEDYSRYMVTFQKTFLFDNKNPASLQNASALERSLQLLNRDVYKWNFFDNFIDLFISSYVECIIRLLQPSPPFANPNSARSLKIKQVITVGEQLLLDLDLLKRILHSLSERITGSTGENPENRSVGRIKKHIDTNLEQLQFFFKILVAPLDSAEDYCEIYSRFTSLNTDPSIWAFIFSLKGAMWDLAFWENFWRVFQENITLQKMQKDEKNLFIFKWDRKHFKRFQTNLSRIQDPSWTSFIEKELKIKSHLNK